MPSSSTDGELKKKKDDFPSTQNAQFFDFQEAPLSAISKKASKKQKLTHKIPTNLSDAEKAVYLLKKGNKVQKEGVLESLVELWNSSSKIEVEDKVLGYFCVSRNIFSL